ncbi:MAG TPA: MmoB/DmpM family protein [Pseudonocardiaceae bacterium]
MKNAVGPILRMGDEVEQVIAAIEDDNPDKEIEVIDRGSYVRVQTEDRMVLTEATLRRYLGRDFEIRSLGTMMSSFAGRAITTSDSITWENVSSRRRTMAGEGATS